MYLTGLRILLIETEHGASQEIQPDQTRMEPEVQVQVGRTNAARPAPPRTFATYGDTGFARLCRAVRG